MKVLVWQQNLGDAHFRFTGCGCREAKVPFQSAFHALRMQNKKKTCCYEKKTVAFSETLVFLFKRLKTSLASICFFFYF